MERIASFTINHLELFPGLYVSRRDRRGDCVITTFDMRITAPNREPVVDMPALHTIEHMAATYLRNSDRKEDIVYFGPMGCRTGCYIVMFGDLNPEDIYELVCKDGGVDRAIRNAKRRMESFDENGRKPSEFDPGTTVYKLVEERGLP